MMDERLSTDESQKVIGTGISSSRKNILLQSSSSQNKNSMVMNNLNKYFAKEIAKHDESNNSIMRIDDTKDKAMENKKKASGKKMGKFVESKESKVPSQSAQSAQPDESCNIINTERSNLKFEGETQMVKPTNTFKVPLEGILKGPKYLDSSEFENDK